jgi:hypothetical protein
MDTTGIERRMKNRKIKDKLKSIINQKIIKKWMKSKKRKH